MFDILLEYFYKNRIKIINRMLHCKVCISFFFISFLLTNLLSAQNVVLSGSQLTISHTNVPLLRLEDTNAGANDAEIRLNSIGFLTFYGGADGTGIALDDFMTLNDSGKLGIGSAVPTHQLHVNAPNGSDIMKLQLAQQTNCKCTIMGL